MGNGAGVAAGNHRQLPTYDYIEKLVLKGHFHRNIDDYTEAVEECIKNNKMDILEILIPAGNAASILPLHIAARLGSIDACELLISAGFDYLAVNVHGHTPLHCCPLNRSNEAILCTTLLGLRGPKAVNMRDKRKGNTPLHIAVENNNAMSVASLLNIKGVIPTMANSFGETSKQLAQKLGCEDIVDLIEQKIEKKTGNGRNGSNGNIGGYGGIGGVGGGKEKKAPVDEDRIMKIWGAFFENAMKQVECEEGFTMDNSGYEKVERTVKSSYNGNSSKKSYGRYDEDDNDDNKIDDNYLPSPYKKENKSSKQKVHYNEKLQKYDYSPDISLPRTEQSTEHYPDTSPTSQYSSPHDTPHVSPYSSLHDFPHTITHDAQNTPHTLYDIPYSSKHDSPYDYTDYEADYRVVAWLDWICCYDAVSGRLFVQSVTDGTTAWVNDHLYSQQYWYGLIPPAWSDLSTYLSPPTDCSSLVEHGWLTFFDTVSNECYWYNIPLEQSLLCLPIGSDPICDSPWGVSLGLCKYENSSECRTCPHVELCKNSWVAVIAFPQERSAECSPEFSEVAEEKRYEECKGGNEEKSSSIRNSRRDSKLNADEKNEINEKYDYIPSPTKIKEEEKEETVYYFLNKITGTTTWDPPKGWNQLVQGPWNGWMLCMSEESHLDLFWWNPESHESRWVEAEV